MNQVQSFIRELVTNEQFRQRALANPQAALSAFKLTANEEHSLTSLCFRLSADGAGTIVARRPTPQDGWY